ncbi:hypothetical protein F751_6376 [Auxenochlorella protothecoides]|uniref:Calcineurin-like phosphoesterase domain-containing protein n=1 Tax=Auxenochlorella protothecoides TaxID=3075 RepID=A0A087SSB3_AUXPR|nr:hypothetical protein F751_6376 [Auxenochlorella protothecoides]KFM28617.1 hypothetical protein F751_6376 [Auxenochlorella protothecoides]
MDAVCGPYPAYPAQPHAWEVPAEPSQTLVHGVSGDSEHHRTPDDVLLFAGDASDKLENVEWAFQTLASAFGMVVYVPGNHELWVRPVDRARGLHDSAAKLDQIQGLCREYDVRTRPFLLHGTAWVVPLLSWHHASWDREPGMGGKRHAWAFSDYSACVWPDSIPGAGSVGGPGLARWFDAKNEGEGWAAALAGVREHDVISMSHFLPREELLPEKRFLFFPELPSVSGSDALQARVTALRPDIHIFGHTHFAWDATLDGTRYIQAPLCSFRERSRRLQTLRLGLKDLKSVDPATWLPALIYEFPLDATGAQRAACAIRKRAVEQGIAFVGPGHAHGLDGVAGSCPLPTTCGLREYPGQAGRESRAGQGWSFLKGGAMPPTYTAAWSEYYRRCERDPTNTEPAPWVAKAQERRKQRAARSRAANSAATGAES